MLSEVLSNRRRSLGMSVDQLAETSGVPKSTVAKVLTGVSSNPAIETVRSIAHALGLTLNDIDRGAAADHIKADESEILGQYRALDAHGKRLIKCVLELELQRCQDAKPAQRIQKIAGHQTPILAEAICDGSLEIKEAARREHRDVEFSKEPAPNLET